MSKVRWGILSTAKIAVTKVIPGIKKGVWSEVTAIASRDRGKAEDAARTLGIPKSYGSYEELLADLEIETIYNPLPCPALAIHGAARLPVSRADLRVQKMVRITRASNMGALAGQFSE
jgi:hypothetical protein